MQYCNERACIIQLVWASLHSVLQQIKYTQWKKNETKTIKLRKHAHDSIAWDLRLFSCPNHERYRDNLRFPPKKKRHTIHTWYRHLRAPPHPSRDVDMPCACHCPPVQSWKVSWLLFTSIGLGTSHLDQVPKTNVGWQANKWSSTLFILIPWSPNWLDLGHGTEAMARYVPFWILFLQALFLFQFFKLMLSVIYIFAYIARKQNLFS